MMKTRDRLIVGFCAGALSHLVFQGTLGAALYAAYLAPDLVWSLKPVGPFGVPTTLNNMFWDGLWGMAYALLEPGLTRRVGRLKGGILVGLAALVVFWFVVLPLKGAGIGGDVDGATAVKQVVFDSVFGLGMAIVYAAGTALLQGWTSRPRPSAEPWRKRTDP